MHEVEESLRPITKLQPAIVSLSGKVHGPWKFWPVAPRVANPWTGRGRRPGVQAPLPPRQPEASAADSVLEGEAVDEIMDPTAAEAAAAAAAGATEIADIDSDLETAESQELDAVLDRNMYAGIGPLQLSETPEAAEMSHAEPASRQEYAPAEDAGFRAEQPTEDEDMLAPVIGPQAAAVPPPEPARGRRRAKLMARPVGPRARAMASVACDHGRISFYQQRNFFEAVCGYHPQCVLSRTANGRPSPEGVCGGRPLGFLMRWLQDGAFAPDKGIHWDQHCWAMFTQEERLAARRELAGLDGGAELLACERATAEGEAEEPATLTGLVH